MPISNPHMLVKVRSKLIMASANGQPCALRVSSLYPGYKCAGMETVIGAHLPVQGKGTSTKVTDMAVAYGCKHCHDIIDGPDKMRREYIEKHHPEALAMRMLKGLVETHARLAAKAIIFVRDGEIIW